MGQSEQMMKLSEVDAKLAGAADDTKAEPVSAGFCRVRARPHWRRNRDHPARLGGRERDRLGPMAGAAFLVLEQ